MFALPVPRLVKVNSEVKNEPYIPVSRDYNGNKQCGTAIKIGCD